MLRAAKILAGTAIDLIEDPALLEQATADFRDRLHGRQYVCPIPAGVRPRVPGGK